MKKYHYFMLMGFFALSYGATNAATQPVSAEGVQQQGQQVNNNTESKEKNPEGTKEQVINNQAEPAQNLVQAPVVNDAALPADPVLPLPVVNDAAQPKQDPAQPESADKTDLSVLTKTEELMGSVEPDDNNNILRGIVYTVLNANWSVEKIEKGIVYIKASDGIPFTVNSKEINDTRNMLRNHGLLSPLSLPRALSQGEASPLSQKEGLPMEKEGETSQETVSEMPVSASQETVSEMPVSASPNINNVSAQNTEENKQNVSVAAVSVDTTKTTEGAGTGIVSNSSSETGVSGSAQSQT